MEFMFPIVILAAGLILIFSLSKENKVFFLAGGYFLVLGAWLLVDRIYPDAGAFAGGWGIAFRVLTAAVLVVLAVVFVKEYRKNRKSARGQEAKELPAQERTTQTTQRGFSKLAGKTREREGTAWKRY